MYTKLKTFAILATVWSVPVLVGAQELKGTTLDAIIVNIGRFINSTIIPLLIGVALLIFIWGVIKYVISAGDDDARKNARSLMIYGIVGLAVIIGVWGLVGILMATFGLNSPNVITLPGVPGL